MILRVDLRSAVPPYEQIREQLETMALSGVFAPGQRLPSIRQLAADLSLAPGTVARAYRELETAGVVQSQRGRGTSVVAPRRRTTPARRERELRGAAESFALRARQLGVDADDALASVQQALGEIHGEASPRPA
jgi:GntR family transcriptional regulator